MPSIMLISKSFKGINHVIITNDPSLKDAKIHMILCLISNPLLEKHE